MSVEHVSECPCCQNTHFENALTARDYLVSQQEFRIQRCNMCGLLMTSPRPNEQDISTYYQSDQYISHSDTTTSIIDKVYKTVRTITNRKKVRLVESYSNSGNILDYGSGTGTFLASLDAARWSRTGIEPSLNARQKTANGIQVHPNHADIHQSFDAITLWHVLEHIHNLHDTVTWLRHHLTPNGTLFIAVPNFESKDAAIYRSKWAAYDVPRHLWHFNKKNMRQLLHNHGLQVIDIRPMYFDAFYVSLLSEQHAHPNRSSVVHACKALVRGLQSNIMARPNNYSSLIYIAKHE
jgi:2-polyprenyl-3-methyl-5-hydroxy-6-metoxy-1,4-benzoquinol methylase